MPPSEGPCASQRMEPRDQDATHSYSEQTPSSRAYLTDDHWSFNLHGPHPANTSSQRAASHRSLPPLHDSRTPGQPLTPYEHTRHPSNFQNPQPRAYPGQSNHTNYSPPVVTANPDTRHLPPASHAVTVLTPGRSYSVDSGTQRTANLSALPGPEGKPALVHAGAASSAEPPRLPMEHQTHAQHQYGHPIEHQAVHGPPPHGVPLVHPHEQYQQHHHAPAPPHLPPGYPPAVAYGHPPAAYPASTPYGSNGPSQGRRKAVRAQQACQQCRTRKQKCDEQKPCTSCAKEDLKCEYREAQVPKLDKTAQQLQDKIDLVLQSNAQILAALQHHGIAIATSEEPRPVLKRKSESTHQGDDMSPRGMKAQYLSQNIDDTMEDATSDDTAMPQSAISDQVAQNFHHGQQVQHFETKLHLPEAHQSQIPFGLATLQTHTNGLQPQPTDMSVKDLAFGAVPKDHATTVDHLRKWPEIEEFYRAAGHENFATITQYEETRGSLRLFGAGQCDDVPVARHLLTPESRQMELAAGSPPGSNVSEISEPEGPYGLEGNLNLDSSRVERLFDKYFKSFHPLQPFMDQSHATSMMRIFTRRYETRDKMKPESTSPSAPSRSTSNRAYLPHLSIGGEDYGMQFEHRRRTLERSLPNAVILLVLANGRIADHMKQLPGPAPEFRHQPISHSTPRTMNSPASSIRQSPATSHTSPSMPSPMTDIQSNVLPRMSSQDFHIPRKNMDAIPGLAYYAVGLDILSFVVEREKSNPQTGHYELTNLLHQVWAYTLASLYMGQLARTREAWVNICNAAEAWRRLKEQFSPRDLIMDGFRSKMTGDAGRAHEKNVNLVRLAFWTLLQLESDIRAECNFPDTGLGALVDDIGFPKQVSDKVEDEPSHTGHAVDVGGDVYFFFSLQIQFRRLLNRTHNMVYKKGSWSPSARNAAEILLHELEDLRGLIVSSGDPEELAEWDGSEVCSSNVNIARVRGKYYGARHVLYRIFLQGAMRWKNKQAPPSGFTYTEGLGVEELPNSDELPMGILLNMEDGREIDDSVLSDDNKRVYLHCAGRAIRAALKSTVVFDGLYSHNTRLFLTNIHGTATAQYGNMLVVSAAYLSWLEPLVPVDELITCLDRTTNLLMNLAPLSKIMEVQAEVLIAARKKVKQKRDEYRSREDFRMRSYSSFGG